MDKQSGALGSGVYGYTGTLWANSEALPRALRRSAVLLIRLLRLLPEPCTTRNLTVCSYVPVHPGTLAASSRPALHSLTDCMLRVCYERRQLM